MLTGARVAGFTGMGDEVELAEALFKEGNATALNIAVKDLEVLLEKSTDNETYYLILTHLVKFNYHLGNFEAVISIMGSAEGRAGFPFAHWVPQQYIRSFVSALVHSAEPERLLELLPGNVLLAGCIKAIYQYWCSSLDNSLVERCFDEIKDFNELVALVALFSFFSVKFDSELVDNHALRFPSEAAAYPVPVGFFNEESGQDEETHYLFCCGTPRSGTTALGNMLNKLEAVALFTELYSPYLGYSPGMFSEEKYAGHYFSKHRHYASNLEIVKNMDANTQYVGDKRPSFLHSWQITKRNFDRRNIKIINLIRDPADVMASYAKRAAASCKLKDNWRPEMSAFVAELDLINQYKTIREIQQSDYAPGLMPVRYPEILTDADALKALFDFLQIKLSDKEKTRMQAEIDNNENFLRHRPERTASGVKYRFLSDKILAWYRAVLH